ncbi:MerR family transcriptional regulator [bacterium]|nr:MerR family transcriptional regulator [bacterium]
MMSPQIPDKLYFSIGEVSQIAGLRPHVLRYWESEFSCLKPEKDKAGRRSYRRKDIETILHIKDLLYNQRYNIAGARKKMKEKGGEKPEEGELTSTLRQIGKDLQSVLKMVSK